MTLLDLMLTGRWLVAASCLVSNKSTCPDHLVHGEGSLVINAQALPQDLKSITVNNLCLVS